MTCKFDVSYNPVKSFPAKDKEIWATPRFYSTPRLYVNINRYLPFFRICPDSNIKVAVGNIDDPETYANMQVQNAKLVVATNSDLTKYLRSLRLDMQILSRASEDRNVSTLHRAGADFVMSYASLGANTIFNRHGALFPK